MSIAATPQTENVLSRLEGVKRNGSGWIAKCPAHNDRRPSLSVSPNENGVVLLHCHAGCLPEDVLSAIGLGFDDLFPDDKRRPDTERPHLNGHSKPQKRDTFATADEAIAAYERKLGQHTAAWRYHDKRGGVCGVVVRWDSSDGKTFRQISRADEGRWRMKAMDEPRPLYRLGELSGHSTVYVCEGEKCCDALAALGFAATTSPGGSKAAHKGDWRTLAGRDVVILPDADEPGRRYAEAVASILDRLGCEVRIVNLPLPAGSGDDVVDLVGEQRVDGKDDAAIRQFITDLAEQSEPWKPSDDDSAGPVLTCLADVEPREVAWLWPGRVPLGRTTLIVGRPGEGKSFLTTYMAANVTLGREWTDGSACPCGSVILVSAEDDPGDTIRPRLDAHGADVRKVHLLSAVRRMGDDGKPIEAMFTLADLPALEAALKRTPDCRLIVIDPIGSVMGGRTDAHRDNEVRAVLAPVAMLAEKYSAAVLLVAHRRKSAGNVADDLALGSRAFTGIARAVWHLSHDPADKSRRLLLAGKNNLAPEGEGLAFTIEGHPPAIHWEPDTVSMNADDALAVENTGDDGEANTKRDAAAKWLKAALADEPLEAKIVRRMAKQNSITERTLADAKNDIDAESHKLGFGNGAKWYWCLPGTWDEAAVKANAEECKGDAEVCKGENSASFEGGLHPSHFQAKNGDSDGADDAPAHEGCKGENSAHFEESCTLRGGDA